ncbi:MAG: DM13 domain-containing protein [Actinomycetota bacterium]
MSRNLKLGIGAAALAVVLILAFGVFGIHTAFIDNEVSEDNPFADVDTGMAERFDDMEDQMASGEIVVDQRVETTAEDAAMPDAMAEDAAPQVETLASNNGVMVDHAHRGQGTANVISDGTLTFLRFEDDFAIDNGPDLNVYLVRGVGAEGPAGQFDDDFVDLGDLKGNIGAQNYEVPADVDITEFDTVVIWCVRFGVAFNAADLS